MEAPKTPQQHHHETETAKLR